MTKEEFHQILNKPEKECDGYEVHIRHLWKDGNAKRLFETTGLDFTEMFNQRWAKPQLYCVQCGRPIYGQFNYIGDQPMCRSCFNGGSY